MTVILKKDTAYHTVFFCYVSSSLYLVNKFMFCYTYLTVINFMFNQCKQQK